MINHIELTALELRVRDMVKPYEVNYVPKEVAAAVVDRIAHTRSS